MFSFTSEAWTAFGRQEWLASADSSSKKISDMVGVLDGLCYRYQRPHHGMENVWHFLDSSCKKYQRSHLVFGNTNLKFKIYTIRKSWYSWIVSYDPALKTFWFGSLNLACLFMWQFLGCSFSPLGSPCLLPLLSLNRSSVLYLREFGL